MKKLVIALLIIEVRLAFTAQSYSMIRDESLHSQDGDCWFRNYNLTPGEPKCMEKPCERWQCILGGTYPMAIVEGCEKTVSARYALEVPQNESNVYPTCCKNEISLRNVSISTLITS
uniref:Single domain-containing protein n=1 Tax=Amblyomma parvum TaxID=251391 RepID=A0A023G2B0_AMBPA